MEKGPFDLLSAAIGFVVGLLTMGAIVRLRQPARNLWGRVRERALGARRWISSGVEARYRHETAEYVQKCHLGSASARLDEIFVPTPLIAPPPDPGPKPGELLPQPQLPHLWPELCASLGTAPPPSLPVGSAVLSIDRLAVLAPPGGGKSTLLAYLALRYSEDPELVPLYAHLAELSVEPEGPSDETPVEEPLLRALQRRAGPLTADSLPGILRHALEAHRAVILLDGWDELAAAERPVYTQWIERLIDRFPQVQLIASAPAVGYGPFLTMGFMPLYLRPWQSEEVSELLHKWARALGLPVPLVPAGQELGAAKVPDLSFWQLGQTPIDATLGIFLTLAGRTPSPRQARRYAAAVQHLVGPAQDDETDWPLQIGPPALARLAGRMAEARTGIASREALQEIVADCAVGHEEVTRRDLQHTIDTLIEESGLLVTWAGGRLAFRSASLYAYFWAAHQALTGNHAVALERLQDPDWSHAISFLIEMTDSGPVVEQLLLAPPDVTREHLFRVADWMSKAQGSEQWHRSVMVRLAQLLLNADTPTALRERAAAALIATHDEGVGFLLRQAINSPNQALRAVAAAGLGALSIQIPGQPVGEKSLDALVQALNDPSEPVQAAAISALGFTRSRLATETLIRTLLESHATARRLAAEALSRIGPEGHEILREALTEDEVLVRRAALFGLAHVSEEWVNDTLAQVIRQDSEWFIRSTADEMLNQRLAPPAPDRIEPVRAENLAWLISLAAERGQGVPAGPRAMTLLTETLEERQRPAVRAMAARSLGDIGQPDSSSLVLEALRDPDNQVREAAFFALARLNRAWNQAPT